MRLPIFLMATCLLAAGGCSTTPRWSPVAPPRQENWHSPSLLILRYDSDNDGIVTRRELGAGLRQDFWQADRNRDGYLDEDEVRAANLRRIRLDASVAIPILDWNHDGIVDFDELATGIRSLFDQLDANGDGTVTMAEMQLRVVASPAKPPNPPSTPAPAGTP